MDNDQDHATFMASVKAKVLEGMNLGVELGWWPSFDSRGPHPWPWHFNLRTHELRREVWLDAYGWSCWKLIGTFPEIKFLSQLLKEVRMFESVGQARKAGFDKELVVGDFWFKSKSIHVEVVDED